MADNFRGDNTRLCESIDALLSLDASGSLVPHGIGGHARTLLESAATRLRALSPAGGDFRERIMQQAKFRAACYALVGIVEGIEGFGRRWSANGERLKDTPEWVKFYNAVGAMRDGKLSLLHMFAASPQQEPGAVGGSPSPNWCRTCGKHRNDRMALLCVDRIHPHNAETKPTTADDPSGQTLAGAGGDGVEFFTIPVGLHPHTVNLVARFATALADKLAKAEQKYGYSDGWASLDWMDECRAKLMEHVAKGDPRDVAAYCAFLWHHNERTALTATSAGTTGDDSEDAARYRMIRNGLSDVHGDCYAMTFAADGDHPVVGADLDNRVDRMIERAARRAREVGNG